MFANGTLMAPSGTAIVATFAHQLRKPFYVVCQTYKFSEKNQIDSISCNKGIENVILGQEDMMRPNGGGVGDRHIKIPYD